MALYDRGSAVKALQTRLYNNMPTGFDVGQVKWLNTKFTTPNNQPWIRESTTLLEASQDPCKWKRDDMFYTLDIFYPTGSFINSMYDTAKELRQLFENQVFDNVKCLNVEIEDIGEEEQWYQIQLNINFYYEGL